jgi:hypothetical protein
MELSSGKYEMVIKFLLESLKERDSLRDVEAKARLIMKMGEDE